jgi:hypothetical protein
MRWFKSLLTRVGHYCSSKTIHRLNAALNYLETGRWMRAQGHDTRRRFQGRKELFADVSRPIKDERVLYLEFGVHRGASIARWARILSNPEARLSGFDSFEGLPEDWVLGNPKGQFSTGGNTPDIDDPRVEFVVGWFEDTLPTYTPPPHDRLVLHLDADLYSSTILVLNALDQYIVPGTFIFFDEFSDRLHELRAFDEYIKRTGAKFRLLGVDKALVHVGFERIE